MSFTTRVLSRFGLSAAAPAAPRAIRFADLSEMPDPTVIPVVDRPDIDEAALTPEQGAWRRDGVLILRGFIPDDVLDPYIARRAALGSESPENFRPGWRSPTPYEHVPELRALCLYPPLMRMMEHLIGEPMMLHLNLTGWVSTERDWHQDDYLNPPYVNSWYTAVWIALDHIDPNAGPFEYAPGSQRWPLLRQKKVLACMSPEDRDARDPVTGAGLWPKLSENIVVPAIEAELGRRGSKVEQFLAEKGDVLIWHGRLMHRGSAPRDPQLLRRSLIAHYSGVNHRPDMSGRAQDENGMWYAVFGHPLV